MRPDSFRMRKRALRVALAVSWASSLQLTGCLNNSTRSDLVGEPGKAALLAEQEADKDSAGSRAPAGNEEKKPAGKVVVAGGETPDTHSAILPASGESPQSPKPGFWSFLNGKQTPPVVNDPFADQADSHAAGPGKSKLPGAPVAGKSKLSPSAFDRPSRPAEEKNTFTPDNWFEKEFAKQSATSNWEKEAIASSNSIAIHADRQKVGSASLPEKSAKTALKKPEVSSSPDWSTLAGSAADKTPVKTDRVEIQQASRDDKDGKDDPFAEQAEHITAGRLNEMRASDPLLERQQRLRVQALLSEAHTRLQRGELHAAYRSALLADKIASEHRLTFREGEENPQQFSREVAAAIWRTTNASGETAIAEAMPPAQAGASPFDTVKPAPAQGLADSIAKVPEKSHSVFPNESFATWKPVSDRTRDLIPAPKQAIASSGKSVLPTRPGTDVALEQTKPNETLPQIRPWMSSKVDLPAMEPKPLAAVELSKPALAAPAPLSAPSFPSLSEPAPSVTSKSGTPSGVEFAIAHSVDGNSATGTSERPSTGLDRGHLSDVFESANRPSKGMAAASVDRHRPLLMAPPAPGELAQEPAELKSDWAELANADPLLTNGDRARISQSNFKWRATWSVLGLIGAAVAGFIGMRMSRTELLESLAEHIKPKGNMNPRHADGEPEAGETTLSAQPAKEETEAEPLPFKRVA